MYEFTFWQLISISHISMLNYSFFNIKLQGWGVAVLVGVPHKDAVFKTSPLNLLNERTLKGTFFGNYKPRSDIPSVVEKYMNKVTDIIS